MTELLLVTVQTLQILKISMDNLEHREKIEIVIVNLLEIIKETNA